MAVSYSRAASNKALRTAPMCSVFVLLIRLRQVDGVNARLGPRERRDAGVRFGERLAAVLNAKCHAWGQPSSDLL
jgi:hypothetical protein